MIKKIQLRTTLLNSMGMEFLWNDYPQRSTDPQASKYLIPMKEDNKFHRDIKAHNPYFLEDKTINPEMMVTEIELPVDNKEFEEAKQRMKENFIIHQSKMTGCYWPTPETSEDF